MRIVSCKLPEETAVLLNEVAFAHGKSKSKFLRELVAAELDRLANLAKQEAN